MKDLNDFELNMYYEPGMIIINNLTSSIEEISKKLKSPIKKELKDIEEFFAKCYEEFKNNLEVSLFVSHRLSKEEPYYFDSIEIFAALILTFWSIVYDPIYSVDYNKQLEEFLRNYFKKPNRFLRNINHTNKSKFHYVFEMEMTNADFYFPSINFDDVENVKGSIVEQRKWLKEEFTKSKEETW